MTDPADAVLGVPWFAVVDDEVGGYVITTEDAGAVSRLHQGSQTLAWVNRSDVADHLVGLHNRDVDR